MERRGDSPLADYGLGHAPQGTAHLVAAEAGAAAGSGLGPGAVG